jgi:hypothetical protein
MVRQIGVIFEDMRFVNHFNLSSISSLAIVRTLFRKEAETLISRQSLSRRTELKPSFYRWRSKTVRSIALDEIKVNIDRAWRLASYERFMVMM